MMNARKLLPFILAVFGLVLVAPAQAQPGQDGSAYGVGVSFIGGTTLYAPIHTGSLFIEPHVGFSRRSTSVDIEGAQDRSTSTIKVGAGAFTILDSFDSANVYAGGRLGIERDAQTTGNTTQSGTDFFLGPALGGEYFFGDHVSIGAEGALYYRSIGTPDAALEVNPDDVSQSLITTSAQSFLRLYF